MADTLTHSMHVEVISPDGPIFSEDNVDMVVARAEDGEFCLEKPSASGSRFGNVRRTH